MKPGFSSVPAYAKTLGKSAEYIRRLIKKGVIKPKSVVKVGARFHVNVKLANRDIQEGIRFTHHAAAKPTVLNDKAELDFNDIGRLDTANAQRAKENYIAALKKLEFETKRGELVAIADVDKMAFELARSVRDAILNIPAKIAAELASTTDIHKVTDLLNRELSEALEALADE